MAEKQNEKKENVKKEPKKEAMKINTRGVLKFIRVGSYGGYYDYVKKEEKR